jgi:hypothetical protein
MGPARHLARRVGGTRRTGAWTGAVPGSGSPTGSPPCSARGGSSSSQAAYAAPLILLSQNRQADTDRITAEHDYRVNQVALQHLIAWHRDAHGPDCTCVRQLGPNAEDLLVGLSRDL